MRTEIDKYLEECPFYDYQNEKNVHNYAGTFLLWLLQNFSLINNTFVHELYRSCFHEDSSQKYFTILQDKEWTGGDVFDDYC